MHDDPSAERGEPKSHFLVPPSPYFVSFLRFMKQTFYLISIKDLPPLMTSSDMGIGCLKLPSHQANTNWRTGGNICAVFGLIDLEG